jgi:serine/threonine protein kinase
MAESLEAHGFLGVSLRENFSNLCALVPRAQEIARLGPEQQVSGRPWRYLDRSLTCDGRIVGWSLNGLYREGTYGKIYKAWRMVAARRAADGLYDVAEEPAEVIIKQTQPAAGSGMSVLTAVEINAHIAEALLHVLAWRAVQRAGMPWAVPRPYELFGDHSPALPGWRSMSLCMGWVRGRTLQTYAEKHWAPGGSVAVGVAFLEIIAQVAAILCVLQRSLRLNHRDLKVNNLMIRARRGTPVTLELGGARMSSAYELTIIDFGFACVGCPPPRPPLATFQAGSWFPAGDLCCKPGRDLAQLIYCIHCFFPLDEYLPAALAATVRRWMVVRLRSGEVIDLLGGFTEEGEPLRLRSRSDRVTYNKGIYEFLRRADTEPTACDPVALFRECCRLKMELTS